VIMVANLISMHVLEFSYENFLLIIGVHNIKIFYADSDFTHASLC